MIERGERTVLVGPNGAGKSTLLKILAGQVEFQQGKRKAGHNARIGYYSQHRAGRPRSKQNGHRGGFGQRSRVARRRGPRRARFFHVSQGGNLQALTSVLSGGEKSRLNLIKFLVDPPNQLLMDEPTTHLDINTVESLIFALERYDGTLVFISHDVHFIRKLATKVLHVNAGQIIPYSGSHDYFVEKTGRRVDDRAALIAA